MSNIKIKRALISVTDKKNIEQLASQLKSFDIEIISTGGTAKHLKKNSIKVTKVEDITKFPEILDGRVKTLHPKIYGGILSRKNLKKDQDILKTFDIPSIELVIVNLYKFKDTIKKSKPTNKIVESIDIGGPSLIRATAKNYKYTTIVTDPKDYNTLISQIKENGSTKTDFRAYLAKKAFNHTFEYDLSIFNWFNSHFKEKKLFPDTLTLNLSKVYSMRYGENPHQKAGLYIKDNECLAVNFSNQLQGKELSYNNINDTDAALALVSEFIQPAVAIIKHANPCGVAVSDKLQDAWLNALKTDPVSAFGGVVALNKVIEKNIATHLSKMFLEVIIAPGITESAKFILSKKVNLRVLICDKMPNPKDQGYEFKSIRGGLLVQTLDNKILKKENLKVVSKRKPTKKEFDDLIFAWKVAKHTKSNAIIYAKNQSTTGIGAGQMSRIDSAYIANKKAENTSLARGQKTIMTKGSVVASDAFFPFKDGLIAASEAGVTAVIQPGGSIRDDEVIQAADKRNLAMVFTSIRHFKH